MKKRLINPSSMQTPIDFSLGVETSGARRDLHMSGVVGRSPDGTVPAGIDAQARIVFEKIAAILAGAGLNYSALVKTTVYLTHREDYEAFRAVRQACLGTERPASTLVIVAGLVDSELRIEMDALAQADPI